MTFQIRAALHFLFKIGNRKSHWSDFHVVWKANHWTCQSQYHGENIWVKKNKTYTGVFHQSLANDLSQFER